MSLYREARSGRRRLWIAAGAVLALAAVIVGLVALAGGGEVTEAERLEKLQEDVRPALDALELVAITYRSPEPAMRAGAASQLEVARSTVDDLSADLRSLDAAATTRLFADLDALRRLLRISAAPAEVAGATRAAAAELRSIVGLD